jgi:(4S)-4-hydroxy-5-phosphonooxypentane-2,3-dione isomerase
MHIVLVHVHVKPESIESFKTAILDNARNSIQEPGVVRFDILQQAEDPSRFTLYEVYRTPEDQLKHRESAHYNRWKDAVVDMMAEPRQGIRYLNLIPVDGEFAAPK